MHEHSCPVQQHMQAREGQQLAANACMSGTAWSSRMLAECWGDGQPDTMVRQTWCLQAAQEALARLRPSVGASRWGGRVGGRAYKMQEGRQQVHGHRVEAGEGGPGLGTDLVLVVGQHHGRRNQEGMIDRDIQGYEALNG